MLIGAGSSICGAAAVMAAEPVVCGRAEQVTVAVSTVVVFGTLAIFLYLALHQLNAHYQLLSVNPVRYGIFAGSTIHEVSQVVAAGRAITDAAANTPLGLAALLVGWLIFGGLAINTAVSAMLG
jgi:uncharacterized integral membrane protein (TIGR00698 family)